MERVKESLDDGYCDISGRKDNLHHIGILIVAIAKLSPEYHLLFRRCQCQQRGIEECLLVELKWKSSF